MRFALVEEESGYGCDRDPCGYGKLWLNNCHKSLQDG
jgi:hypothetical protein